MILTFTGYDQSQECAAFFDLIPTSCPRRIVWQTMPGRVSTESCNIKRLSCRSSRLPQRPVRHAQVGDDAPRYQARILQRPTVIAGGQTQPQFKRQATWLDF